MKLTNKAPRKKSPVYASIGYSGYSSKSKLFGNSSFWMDTDFIPNSKESRKDMIQLAAYKRAISNFVKIVTGKSDINVRYSSGVHSYTDGSTVVISSSLDEKEFDSTVGLALHEGSHCILTDFNILRYPSTLCNNVGLDFQTTKFDKLKDLINIIEDRRIDKFVYDSSPGYQGYYTAMYNKYFNAKEIDLALINKIKRTITWDDYLFHICNFMNPNRTLDILPGLREIWNLIDIRNISRLKSTLQVARVAADVYRIIESNILEAERDRQDKSQSQKESQSQEEGDNQSQGDAQGSMNQEENDEMGSMDNNLDLPNGSGSSSVSDSNEMDSDNTSSMTDRQLKKLKEAIENQKKFINGNIKKKSVTNKESAQIEAISNANIELVEVGNDNLAIYKRGGKTKCIVVRGLSESILGLDIVQPMVNPYKTSSTQYIDDGIKLGTQLGKKLKTRDENRDLKTTRMDSGRIDKRLIAELGFGNDKVFSQTINYTTTPGLVHISVDASGSMHGDKWNQAMMTAVAVAKAASMVSSLDCIISIRSCSNVGGGTVGSRPLMWIVYDSRKDKLSNNVINMLRKLDCDGSTPEGLCFESIMKDLIKSAAGRDAYFINLSDGEPGFSNNDLQYYGEQAFKHTQSQVLEMRKAGINVLSYFVSRFANNNVASEAFQMMYGKSAEAIDLTSLAQLSRTVNDLFVRK